MLQPTCLQVALSQQEAQTVRSMKQVYEATQAMKRKQFWLSHVVTGVASPMLIISRKGLIRVRHVCGAELPRIMF